MIQHYGEEFLAQRLTGDLALAEPILFEKCHFAASSDAVRSTDAQPIQLSDVTLRSCRVSGGGLRGVHLRDCVVDGLRVTGLPQLLGNIYEHVTLTGEINQLLIETELPTVHDPEPFYRAAEETYRELDWALDIREVDSPDFDIRGVPSRLVRIDPSTQGVATRAAATEGAWRDIDLTGTHFAISLRLLAKYDWDDMILVAPRTGKNASRAAEAIATLRDKGIVEPA